MERALQKTMSSVLYYAHTTGAALKRNDALGCKIIPRYVEVYIVKQMRLWGQFNVRDGKRLLSGHFVGADELGRLSIRAPSRIGFSREHLLRKNGVPKIDRRNGVSAFAYVGLAVLVLRYSNELGF